MFRGCKHGTDLLYHHTTLSMVRIVDEKVWRFLPACLREAQPCPYCFTQWSKNRLFTRCPDKREIWHGGADQKLTTASMNIYATYSTHCNVTLTLSMTSCCDVTLKVSDITAASTLHSFRWALKTHLFTASFPPSLLYYLHSELT